MGIKDSDFTFCRNQPNSNPPFSDPILHFPIAYRRCLFDKKRTFLKSENKVAKGYLKCILLKFDVMSLH